VNQNFEGAFAKFCQFLNDNGYSPNVIWVTPQEVILSGGAAYVKVPVPRRNEELVRELFQLSVNQQVAILFTTICEIDGATCTYAWVQKNDSEAAEALMPDSGVKMSIKSGLSRISGTAVSSKLQWLYFKVRYGRKQRHSKDLFL
jgi:hypothetical protein